MSHAPPLVFVVAVLVALICVCDGGDGVVAALVFLPVVVLLLLPSASIVFVLVISMPFSMPFIFPGGFLLVPSWGSIGLLPDYCDVGCLVCPT